MSGVQLCFLNAGFLLGLTRCDVKIHRTVGTAESGMEEITIADPEEYELTHGTRVTVAGRTHDRGRGGVVGISYPNYQLAGRLDGVFAGRQRRIADCEVEGDLRFQSRLLSSGGAEACKGSDGEQGKCCDPFYVCVSFQ